MAISDKAWRTMKQRLAALEKASVKVGILQENGGSAPHDSKSGLTMVELGQIHEFGTRTIPERPFIRPVAENEKVKQTITKVATNLLGKLHYNVAITKALSIIGATAVAEIQKSIAAHIKPENAPSTIAQKGSDTPLVDTGRLRQAITWAVTGDDDE